MPEQSNSVGSLSIRSSRISLDFDIESLERRNYDWLPDHQLAVAATLAHADDLIAEVTHVLFEYQRQTGGIIELEEVIKEGYSETTVAGIAPIPRKVPLLVADALVSLRNAMEHTLFAEVEHRDGALDEKTAKVVQMPAKTTSDKFQTWVNGLQRNGSLSLKSGSDLLDRIDSLQPYNWAADAEIHPLWLIAQHTNHSKHRAPAITAVRLAAMYREDQMPVDPSRMKRGPEVPLQVGDVIGATPLGMTEHVSLFPNIGINRPGTKQWPELTGELSELCRWTRTQAIPTLIAGVEYRVPALPAKYPITLGYEDEREGISTGTTGTAGRLHRDRLAAATTRLDMAELLTQMPNAPRPEHISGWLESLTDQEILARMHEMPPPGSTSFKSQRQMISVLESMVADANNFALGDRAFD